MAHFKSISHFEVWARNWCMRCVHGAADGFDCPLLNAHQACQDEESTVLEILIHTAEDGNPGDCQMFHQK